MAADITPESMPLPDASPGATGSNSGTTSYKPDGQSGSPESSQTRGADSGTADAGRSGDSGWDSGSGSNGTLPEDTPAEATGTVEDVPMDDDPLNHMKDFGDTASQDIKDVQAAQGFVSDMTEDDEEQGEEEETAPEKAGNFFQRMLSGGKSGISDGLTKLRAMTANGMAGLAGSLGVSTGVLTGVAGALGLGGFLTIFALLFGAQNYKYVDEYQPDCRVITAIAENEARAGINYYADLHFTTETAMNGAKQIYSYFNTPEAAEIMEYEDTFYVSQQGNGLGGMAVAAIASVCNGESGVVPSRYEFDYIKNYAFNRYAFVNWNEYTLHMFNLYDNGYIAAPSADDYLAKYSPNVSKLFVEPTAGLTEGPNPIDRAAYQATDGLYYPGLGLVAWTGDRTLSLMLYADMIDMDDYRQEWNKEMKKCADEGRRFTGIERDMINDNDFDGHADRMWAMDTQLAFMLAEWTGKISAGQDTDPTHWGSESVFTDVADAVEGGTLVDGTWNDFDRIEAADQIHLAEYPFVPHFLFESCRDVWSRGGKHGTDATLSAATAVYGPFYPDSRKDEGWTDVPNIVTASELYWESRPWNFKATLCTDHATGTAHKGIVYEDFDYDVNGKNIGETKFWNESGTDNVSADTWDYGTPGTSGWTFSSTKLTITRNRLFTGNGTGSKEGPAYPFFAYMSSIGENWIQYNLYGYRKDGKWHEGHDSTKVAPTYAARAAHPELYCQWCEPWWLVPNVTRNPHGGHWDMGCTYRVAINYPYIYSQAESFMAMYVSGGGMDDLVDSHLELAVPCVESQAKSFWKWYSGGIQYYAGVTSVPQVVDYTAWSEAAEQQRIDDAAVATPGADVSTGESGDHAEWKTSEQNGKTLLDLVTRNICLAGMESRISYYEKNPTCAPPQGLEGIAAWAVSWAWPQSSPSAEGASGRYYSINASGAVGGADPWTNHTDWNVNDPVVCHELDGKHPTGSYARSKMARCTEAYVRIRNFVLEGDLYYSSCDRGAATAVRAAGADDNFPAGAPEGQDAWCRQHPDIWQYMGTVSSSAECLSICEPGDVLIRPEPSHIIIYVGGELAHEKFPEEFSESDPCIVHSSIGTRGPRLDKEMGSASPGYNVYRCINPMGDDSKYAPLLKGISPDSTDWDWGEEPTTTEDGGQSVYATWSQIGIE